MKNLLLLSAGFITCSMQAQITLTSATGPVPGDVYYRDEKYQGFNPSIVPGNAGASQTWNFTNPGLADYHDTLLIMDINWLPSGITAGHSQCNSAIQYGSDTSYFDLLRIDAGGFYLEASVSDYGQFGIQHQNYSDPLKYMEWPCAYGSSWVDVGYSDYTYPTSPTDSAHDILTLTYDSEADAWGSLTLDNGTYNVIRIHRIIMVNVMYQDYTPSGGWTSFQTYTDTVETYEFWTNTAGNGWPIAQIQLDDFGNVEVYTTMVVPQVGMEENGSMTQISIFPNPVSEHFTLKASGDWVMYNMNGEAVKNGVAAGEAEIDVADLANGVYVLGISDESGVTRTSRVVVHH